MGFFHLVTIAEIKPHGEKTTPHRFFLATCDVTMKKLCAGFHQVFFSMCTSMPPLSSKQERRGIPLPRNMGNWQRTWRCLLYHRCPVCSAKKQMFLSHPLLALQGNMHTLIATCTVHKCCEILHYANNFRPNTRRNVETFPDFMSMWREAAFTAASPSF